jgi:protein-S-isoprenylcysteine O-methyltransferase Ste14
MENKRKILPTMYLFMCLAIMWPLHMLLPVYQYVHEPLAYAGIILLFAGIVIAALAAGMFVKADTGLLPFEEATTLITGGFYRFTRNPMYLGMILVLLGVAILLGSVGALTPVLLFTVIIRYSFVAAEERFMEAAFGQQYLDYKARVRRWI